MQRGHIDISLIVEGHRLHLVGLLLCGQLRNREHGLRLAHSRAACDRDRCFLDPADSIPQHHRIGAIAERITCQDRAIGQDGAIAGLGIGDGFHRQPEAPGR